MEFYYDESDDNILIIQADGGLNGDNANEFVGRVEGLVDAGLKKIIVDCDRLTFLSSIGMASLMRLHKRMTRHGGDVKIANVHSVIAELLHVARLDKLFAIYPDVGQARLAFREG
jgi:anti-sigma B factor antagonist